MKPEQLSQSRRYHNVAWTTPSRDCHGSMPLGNGDVSLNVWGEDSGDVLFYIGKTARWEDNGRLAKVGKIRLRFCPALWTEGVSFRQELDLEMATIRLKHNWAIKRQKSQSGLTLITPWFMSRLQTRNC